MHYSNRTRRKIISYALLLKKLGIINEQEFQQITGIHYRKDHHG